MDLAEYNLIAEAISLAMTFPTVILGLAVVYLWGPPAWKAMRSGTLDAQGWFIVGVVTAFIGSSLDNIYWFFPWAASFLGLEVTDSLMTNGVFFNIFFRQMAGIVAAYCHLRAAAESSKGKIRSVNYLMAASYAIGVVAVGCLFMARAT